MVENDKYIAINMRELTETNVESMKTCECDWEDSENCDNCWYYDRLNWVKRVNKGSYLMSDTVVVFKSDRPYDFGYSCSIDELERNQEFLEDLDWYIK